MIWCIEDDSGIRDIEIYALSSSGFEVKGFEDGLSFWDALKGEKPELILILGGTNDSWIGNEAGELQFEGWSDESMKETLPAACYMLDYITRHNPNAAILFILNSDLRPEIAEGLVAACAHYGVALVRLEDISKQCGHPDVEGMKQIAAQVGRALDAL